MWECRPYISVRGMRSDARPYHGQLRAVACYRIGTADIGDGQTEFVAVARLATYPAYPRRARHDGVQSRGLGSRCQSVQIPDPGEV